MSIAISLVPNRTSGVAPLAVYFDASGTTSTATAFPFNQCAFQWNFGDGAAGNFATTGKSKNVSYGPVSAHVFENPGSYVVTLTVTDSDGTITSTTTTITVTNPDAIFAGTSTIAVSRVGDFSGAPSGSTHLTTTSFATVAAQFAAGRRILFRRGEIWPITTGVTLNVAGPGIIGDFGTGALPRIEMSPGSSFEPIFKCSSTSTPLLNDWRIMNLDLNGSSNGAAWGIYCWGAGVNLTAYRLNIANVGNGIAAPYSQLQANNIPAMNGLSIYECFVQDAAGGGGHNLIALAAARLSILGTEIARSTNGEHVMRLFWVQGGVLSNNRHVDAPQPRHLLKIHAPIWGQSGIGFHQYTENMVISDNLFEGTGGTQIPVDVGPQNDTNDERVRRLIYERNYTTTGPAVQQCSNFSVSELSVRYNIYNMGAARDAVYTLTKATEPAPANIWIQQNTCLSTNVGGPIIEHTQSSVIGLYLYNNIAAGPAAQTIPTAQLPYVTASGGNMTGTAAAAAFLGGSAPSSIDGFALTSVSPAVGQGNGPNTITPDFKQRAVRWGTGAPNDDSGALQLTASQPGGNCMFFASPLG